MKYVGFQLNELDRVLYALREDGAVYMIEWQREGKSGEKTKPVIRCVAQLPADEAARPAT